MGDRVLGQVPALSRARATAARWSALAAALVLVAGIDLARPYLGPALRGWHIAACVLAVAVLAATLRRDRSWREVWAPVLLAAALVPLAVDHPRSLESDGIHYYTWLRSLMVDGDLELRNDYRQLGSGYDRPNVMPVGAPVLWAPLVVPLHLGRLVFGSGAPDATEPLYQAAACLMTIVWAVAGLFLLLDTLRSRFGAATAFWTTLLVWLGSPLRFYLAVLPSLAHGGEFFAAVLVLRAWLSLRERLEVRRAALAGAACGLVFLTRSQDGLLLLLPGIELLFRFARGRDRRRVVVAGAALAGAFVLAALPQFLVWQVQFGVPFLIPHEALHGEAFLHESEPRLVDALVSERGGLFTSHPVLLVAFAGLLLRARRDLRGVVTILPVVLATWWLNASLFDWYHVRRYTGIVPVLSTGLAAVVQPLARAGPVPLLAATLLVWRYDVAVDASRAQQGEPAPVREVLGHMADGTARALYGVLEPVAPAAAVRLLGAYTGAPLLDGPVSSIDLDGDPWVLRVPAPARSIDAATVEDGRIARWITAQDARLFLPIQRPGPLIVTISLRALDTIEPQSLSLSWNGRDLGRQPTRPEWAEYRFDVPADAVRVGTNELALGFERAPLYRRMRGDGPRGIRPAALGWIELHRR